MTGCHQLVAVTTKEKPAIICKRCGGRWPATDHGIEAAATSGCREVRQYGAPGATMPTTWFTNIHPAA